MNKANVFIGIVAFAALVVGVVAYLHQSAPPAGGVPGSDFYSQTNFYAGILRRGQVATTSQASSETLTANELIQWGNASVVSLKPGLSAVTITLPASSTLKSFIPTAGDSQRICVNNATSTAATVVTFAGALGTKLLVASSSATALGSATLVTGKVGCFDFIREAASSTAFDIDALYTAFQ